MNNNITNIRKKLKEVYTNIISEKDKYPKHTSVCINLKTKSKIKEKQKQNKLQQAFLLETEYKVCRILKYGNRKTIFFGKKETHTQLQKIDSEIIYGYDIDIKNISRDKYYFCVIEKNAVLGKYKNVLVKHFIYCINQDNYVEPEKLVNLIKENKITKYHQQQKSFSCKIGDTKNNNIDQLTENSIKFMEQVNRNDECNILKLTINKNMCKSYVIYNK